MNKKLLVGIIIACSVLDFFGGSIPFLGVISQAIFETITAISAVLLLK